MDLKIKMILKREELGVEVLLKFFIIFPVIGDILKLELDFKH